MILIMYLRTAMPAARVPTYAVTPATAVAKRASPSASASDSARASCSISRSICAMAASRHSCLGLGLVSKG